MESKMKYETIYLQFKSEFKEDSSFFEDKEKEFDIDNADGPHVQFEIVVIPYIYHLADVCDEKKLKRSFAFFDRMAKSNDKELSSLVQFSILEEIVSNNKYYKLLKKYFTEELNSYLPYLETYIDFDNK